MIEADFGAAESWGWKDPRNCLTFPFWQHVLPPTHHVICLRNPIDVALSLSQRENFPLKKCVDLWLRYMHDALKHTSGKPRLLIFYEDLMANWPAELRRLAAFLGRPETADQADVQSAVKDFVDEDLRHYHATLIDAVDNADLGFPAKAMYVLLRACVNAAPNERDTFGEAADRVQQVLDSFSGYSLEAEESAGRLMELAAKLEEEKSQACRELQSFVISSQTAKTSCDAWRASFRPSKRDGQRRSLTGSRPSRTCEPSCHFARTRRVNFRPSFKTSANAARENAPNRTPSPWSCRRSSPSGSGSYRICAQCTTLWLASDWKAKNCCGG